MQVLRLTVTSATESTSLTQAVEALQRGDIVVFPTETTYGLGVDATNPSAVQKLLQYKTQRGDKPLSILVKNQEQAEEFVQLSDSAKQAYGAFLPGPVTVVSVGKHQVAPGVESVQGTLGVRISSYPLAQKLAEQFGKPITATSANASGKKRPYRVEDILENTSARQQDLISVILDVGELAKNPPSTVIDTTLDTLQVLRQGESLAPQGETLQLSGVDETIDWGKLVAQRFRSSYGYQPVIFALNGPMGVGKTHVAKGIAAGLGITDTVVSPSYTLLNEYIFINEGQTLPLWHIDAWRTEHAQELEELGIQHLLQSNGVLILEWSQLAAELLETWPQAQIVSITLAYGTDENERKATLSVESHV